MNSLIRTSSIDNGVDNTLHRDIHIHQQSQLFHSDLYNDRVASSPRYLKKIQYLDELQYESYTLQVINANMVLNILALS